MENVIVSHADADHFGGISLLLSDASFQVDKVYLNPDSRDTVLWNDFVSVMVDAKTVGLSSAWNSPTPILDTLSTKESG